jgi:hypothetical protein
VGLPKSCQFVSLEVEKEKKGRYEKERSRAKHDCSTKVLKIQNAA